MTENENTVVAVVQNAGELGFGTAQILCDSSVFANDPPRLRALIDRGALRFELADGVPVVKSATPGPADPQTIGEFHDRLLLTQLAGPLRQGLLAQRLAAHGIDLSPGRLEALRASGRIQCPAPGLWAPADAPAAEGDTTAADAPASPAQAAPAKATRTTRELVLAHIDCHGPTRIVDLQRALAETCRPDAVKTALRRMARHGEVASNGTTYTRAPTIAHDPNASPARPFQDTLEETLFDLPHRWSLKHLRGLLGTTVGLPRIRKGLAPLVEAGLIEETAPGTFEMRKPDGDPHANDQEARIAQYAGAPLELLAATAIIWEGDLARPTALSTARTLREAGYAVTAPRLRTALSRLEDMPGLWPDDFDTAVAILQRHNVAIQRRYDKRQRLGNTGLRASAA